MRSRAIPIFPLALAALASRAPTADLTCVGWRSIRITESTLDWLADHNPQTLAGLLAQHEQEREMGRRR